MANIPAAIAAYETGMHTRFAEVGKETMENTVWMHSPEALPIMVDFFSHAKDAHDQTATS